MNKPRMAVHKFTSCDGCQLAFLYLGEELIALSEIIDIAHFAEAGFIAPNEKVDIAFVEGSISTPREKEFIQQLRENSKYLITIGACATAGGIQALSNFSDRDQWMQDIYASPKTIATLKTSTPISQHVKVDAELWGCPVNSKQILDAIRSLLNNVIPAVRRDSVCVECKRNHQACVMVTQNIPCMGPVTQLGCGALCPSANRACYACYGPCDHPNTESLTKRFFQLGLSAEEIKRRFLFINNQAPSFQKAGLKMEHE